MIIKGNNDANFVAFTTWIWIQMIQSTPLAFPLLVTYIFSLLSLGHAPHTLCERSTSMSKLAIVGQGGRQQEPT